MVFYMIFYEYLSSLVSSLLLYFLRDSVIYGNIGFKTLFFPCGTFSRIASVAKDRPMCKNISLKSENIFTLFYMLRFPCSKEDTTIHTFK